MDEILTILNDLHSDIDFEHEERLFERGLLDSFDIVTLVSELAMQYGIQIMPKDIVPENFSSAATIHALVQRILNEGR